MKLIYKRQALKQLKHLPKRDKNKVLEKLEQLPHDPLMGKLLGGELKGFRSLKSWPYRIIYIVDKSRQEIWVLSILHRQGAYQ